MTWSERRTARRREDLSYAEWRGGYHPYDLVKEASIAFGVILALVVVLTILFSSPDVKPTTVQSWARTDPVDFATTAVSELDGTSGTATYGPPYNHASDGQHMAFIRLQKWFGVSQPINTAEDFVIAPLRSIRSDPELQSEISSYQAASTKQQNAWTNAYTNALGKASVGTGDSVSAHPGNYGPVAPMMSSLVSFAQSGGLDGALLTGKQFYETDYTKPLMLIADGGAARESRPSRAPAGRAVGDDERDGQLSGPGLALAVHVLVSDQAILDFSQRGHPGHDSDGRPQPALRPRPLPPRNQPHPAVDSDLQADLAPVLPLRLGLSSAGPGNP
ncbi:MAG TPA: hypothetical protein VMD09_15235 [Solirubrobacteraceae bacterium]|nr:hypothetical protein [Solirubrobacteraceae bacterium]